MKRGEPLRRRVSLKRVGLKLRVTGRAEAVRDTLSVSREVVYQRSKGQCEMPNCKRIASHVHHRQLRRHGDHSPENLMHVCSDHHQWIHDHPAESFSNGWMVHSWANPAEVLWVRVEKKAPN